MPAVTRDSNTGTNANRTARFAAYGFLAAGALAATACHRSASGPEHEDPAAWAWNAPRGGTRNGLRAQHERIDRGQARQGRQR